MANYIITITYNPTSGYSHSPLQTNMTIDDTITFDVQAANGCLVVFKPANVFGRRLPFPQAKPYGPYAPSANHIMVSFCVTDINSNCTPSDPSVVESYSIKVG